MSASASGTAAPSSSTATLPLRQADAAPARRSWTLQRQILLLLVAINVAATTLACGWAYYQQRVGYLHGIDRALLGAAGAADELLPDDFTQRVQAGAAIRLGEETEAERRLALLARHLDLTCLACVVQRDGRLQYVLKSAASATAAAQGLIPVAERDATAGLLAALADGATRLEEHDDPIGRLRSVYVPVRPSPQAPVAYVLVAGVSVQHIYADLHETLAQTALMGTVVCGLSLLLAWGLSRRVARPLATLGGHMASIADHDFQMQDAERRQVAELARSRLHEVSCLADTFCRMEGRLRQYLAERDAQLAERERAASDLRIAHDIQVSLLRKDLPCCAELETFATVVPAKEVGGDFYDVVPMDDGRLLIVVADVSGKGVPGGMFMAVTKTLLDLARDQLGSPESIAMFLNDRLAAENDALMFVTMFLGILDTETGELQYTNAGHNPPYVLRDAGTIERLAGKHGMALAIAGGVPYAASSVQLLPGDGLFLYSDGVTESQDIDGRLLTDARLESVLRPLAALPATTVAQGVIEEVRQHQGAAPQADDITVVCVRWQGAAAATGKPQTVFA
jgi:sigma-B regulation protein RsbU (phosphoserine phosphatase)